MGNGEMTTFDLGNLLTMFLESTDKIIRHLEEGYPDRALIRAKKTRDALQKLVNHCIGPYHNGVEKNL